MVDQLSPHPNPGLRARLADIAWLNDKTQAAAAVIAVSAYCEAVRLVADGKAVLFEDERSPYSPPAVDLLRRACQIARVTGWKDQSVTEIQALVETAARRAFDEADGAGYCRIGSLALDYRLISPIAIAECAESLARTNDTHPIVTRELWEVAARAHNHAGNDAERRRCLIEAAERYVAMAAAAGFQGMVAAGWLRDAIAALRNISGTRPRREELEALLREAQAGIRDEMQTFSTEIDLEPLATHAQQSVTALTFAEALGAFADLERSPSPEDLRKEALEAVERNPISNMIQRSAHDEEGKVIHTSSGMMSDDASQEDHLRHLIADHAGFRWHTAAAGLVEPARQRIQAEHHVTARRLSLLAKLSPFVPAGREYIFALGFARFFQGDFTSALHILVPQLENSLRHVLRQAGIDPSSIRSDMMQENRSLSEMLGRDRQALESIFGPAIIFEIENLFDFRGGPRLRHQVAHGLLSDDACEGPTSVYACWFIYRLCCLPLFSRWKDVVAAYAEWG